MSTDNREIKVRYLTVEGSESAAYVDEPTGMGVDKYTDEPVWVRWDEAASVWRETPISEVIQVSTAHRPTGKTLTYEQAATRTGKHLTTIYRWVKHGHIREIMGDNAGQPFWGVAELDVDAMTQKRWTRRPRHTRELT